MMSTDPDDGIAAIEAHAGEGAADADLDPDVREQFVDNWQSALREAAVRKIEVEQARQQQQENDGRRQRTALGRQETGTQRDEGEGIDGAVQLADERETVPRRGGSRRGRSDRSSPQQSGSASWRVWKPAWWATMTNFMELRTRAAEGRRRHPLSGREISHSVPRRSADRLSRRRSVAAVDGRRKEKYSSMDLAQEGNGREEDRRRAEVADSVGLHRSSAAGRDRLSEGQAQDRDPDRQARSWKT